MAENGCQITIKTGHQEREMIRRACGIMNIGGKKSMAEFCEEASVARALQVLKDEEDWERFKIKYKQKWGTVRDDFIFNFVMDNESMEVEIDEEVDDPLLEEIEKES